ncbi:MAG: hypothetical protein HY823_11025 [Acidobacteria bacterium]|nr:hypothetical protein [Acidobacteriota bacterium]
MAEIPSSKSKAIPEQLLQIAKEQEGGAERVLGQIEVVESSFQEIQALIRECQELLRDLVPPSPEKDALVEKMEAISVHVENGVYNVSGVFDLFQYQDIIRQKLEKVGHRLIDVSHFVLANLQPAATEEAHMAPAGRDILAREAQVADKAKEAADAVVAEFFAKLRPPKPPA